LINPRSKSIAPIGRWLSVVEDIGSRKSIQIYTSP
jgi:hypothetical protein